MNAVTTKPRIRLMTGTVAHLAALQLIKDIAEGSTTANSLPHIAKIAAAALGGQVQAEMDLATLEEPAS